MRRLALLFILIFTAASPAYSERKVDSYEKLNLLRQATGNPNTATDGFQARVNTILNPAHDAEQSIIENEDAAAREEARQNQTALVQADVKDVFTVSSKDPSEPGLIQSRDKDNKVKTYVDNSEETYQKLQNLPVKKEEKEPVPGQKTDSKPGEKSSTPGLRPSLANNPFYKGDLKNEKLDPMKKFEMMKPVFISRLAQSMGQLDAESLVSRASTQEDLIVILMQDNQSLTFQQASDFVATADEEENLFLVGKNPGE